MIVRFENTGEERDWPAESITPAQVREIFGISEKDRLVRFMVGGYERIVLDMETLQVQPVISIGTDWRSR